MPDNQKSGPKAVHDCPVLNTVYRFLWSKILICHTTTIFLDQLSVPTYARISLYHTATVIAANNPRKRCMEGGRVYVRVKLYRGWLFSRGWSTINCAPLICVYESANWFR